MFLQESDSLHCLASGAGAPSTSVDTLAGFSKRELHPAWVLGVTGPRQQGSSRASRTAGSEKGSARPRALGDRSAGRRGGPPSRGRADPTTFSLGPVPFHVLSWGLRARPRGGSERVLLAAQSLAHRARRQAEACTPEPGLFPPAGRASDPSCASPTPGSGFPSGRPSSPAAVTCLHDEPRHSEVHPRLGCWPPLGTPRRVPCSTNVRASSLHEAPPRGPRPPAGRRRGPSARRPAPGVLAAGAATRPAGPPPRPCPRRPASQLPAPGQGGGEERMTARLRAGAGAGAEADSAGRWRACTRPAPERCLPRP